MQERGHGRRRPRQIVMYVFVGLLVTTIVLFAVVSSAREISVYRKALKGEPHYLVSRKRLNRRLGISALLLLEGGFVFVGFFLVSFTNPFQSLVYWLPPLLLIFLVVYLSILDFRETSKDLDRILRESSETVREKIKEQRIH